MRHFSEHFCSSQIGITAGELKCFRAIAPRDANKLRFSSVMASLASFDVAAGRGFCSERCQESMHTQAAAARPTIATASVCGDAAGSLADISVSCESPHDTQTVPGCFPVKDDCWIFIGGLGSSTAGLTMRCAKPGIHLKTNVRSR